MKHVRFRASGTRISCRSTITVRLTGCFFLVLEYVPGGSLKQRLGEPLSPRTAAGLMETIARAVGYIHGRGLFHLDLKPSNILMDGEVGAPLGRGNAQDRRFRPGSFRWRP